MGATSAAAATPDRRTVASAVQIEARDQPQSTAAREAVIRRLEREGNGPALRRQLAAMAAQGPVGLSDRNATRLLVDGPQTFAAMFDAIGSARREVLLESYIFEDAAVAQRLAALLMAKRQAGVHVAVLYDDVGSIGTDQAFFDRLRDGGVAVCAFNPINPLKRPGHWGLSHRDHRKILAVDERIGFTGGINISAVYSSGSFGSSRPSRRPAPPPPARSAAASAPSDAASQPANPQVDTDDGWRDTQVRLEGQAAAELAQLVRGSWQRQGCKGELPASSPTPPPTAGDDVVRILSASPDDHDLSPIAIWLHAAVTASTVSVDLTMAYFAPGDAMIQALCDAARRGVRVRLVLPAVSDFAPVLYAGRSQYDRLLSAGVHIHERQAAVLHAKTAVIDGVVSTVGSSNMDWRSFVHNDEVNAVILGREFGIRMQRLFDADLAESSELVLDRWRQRPLADKAKETLAGWLERWW